MGWGKARFFLIIGLLALALAGAQNAFVDASEDRSYLAASILAAYPADVIVRDTAHRWAYQGRVAGNRTVWPGAASFAAAPTDFWHWSRFWQFLLISLGALWLFWSGYYWPINMRTFGRWGLGFVLLVLGHLSYLGGHWAVWTHALPTGGADAAQALARTWVDGFMWLHGQMQARGILG